MAEGTLHAIEDPGRRKLVNSSAERFYELRDVIHFRLQEILCSRGGGGPRPRRKGLGQDGRREVMGQDQFMGGERGAMG